MNQTRISAIEGLVVFFVAFLWLLPSVGVADTEEVECPDDTIQEAVDDAEPGDTILVSGICKENVIIRNTSRITLDCQGTATIDGSVNTQTIRVRDASRITIRGCTVTGGNSGISVSRSTGVRVERSNVVDTGGTGISVNQNSQASITDTTIQGNAGTGIVINENSSARIGFRRGSATTASRNYILGNGINPVRCPIGCNGIFVGRSSSVRIVGNDISDNTRHGIDCHSSQCDISDNDIDGNGLHGIHIFENGGVNLGRDSGTGIFDAPNRTDPGNLNGQIPANGSGRGISCRIMGYANGRLGTLDGVFGAKSFNDLCFDSLI